MMSEYIKAQKSFFHFQIKAIGEAQTYVTYQGDGSLYRLGLLTIQSSQ